MNRERFYRGTLWLPLAAPLALGAAALVLRNDLLLMLSVPFLAGVWYGGLGYVPFAMIVARRWRGLDAAAIEREYWLLPFRFAPFAAVSSVLVVWPHLDGWLGVLWAVGNYGFAGSLLLGYAYLAMVRMGAACFPPASARVAAEASAVIGAQGT